MNNKKTTKRALLSSVMAIVLCLAMLIGTTFAWFTDSASTAVNKIQAGNLEIELQMKDNNGNWVNAEGKTLPFLVEGKIPAKGTQILWEPGCTYYVPQIRVLNKGNLAVKIEYLPEALGVTGKLAEVLEPVFKTPVDANGEEVNIEPEILKPGEASPAWSFGYHMLETAGNEYQNATATGMCLTVVATQATYENDSNGNTYDKHAKYPDVAYTQASTQDELNTALNNPTDANGNPTSKIAVDLKKGSYTLPGDKMGNKEISITGTEDTVIDLKAGTAAHDASITMEGVTVESTNGNYTGIQHAAATTFKDCVIKGQPFLYAKNVQYINCTFEQDSSSAYNVWTYGAGNVLFKDCTFNCAGKSVLIYNEGSINRQTVEFQNCKFNASAPVAGKAAIEIDSSLLPDGGIYKVIIDQATADNVTGFDNGSVSHNSLWNNKKGTKATVIVAGTTVLSAG